MCVMSPSFHSALLIFLTSLLINLILPVHSQWQPCDTLICDPPKKCLVKDEVRFDFGTGFIQKKKSEFQVAQCLSEDGDSMLLPSAAALPQFSVCISYP